MEFNRERSPTPRNRLVAIDEDSIGCTCVPVLRLYSYCCRKVAGLCPAAQAELFLVNGSWTSNGLTISTMKPHVPHRALSPIVIAASAGILWNNLRYRAHGQEKAHRTLALGEQDHTRKTTFEWFQSTTPHMHGGCLQPAISS